MKASERVRFAQAFETTLAQFDEQWRQWTIARTQGGNGIPVINRAPAGQIVDYEEYGMDSGQGYEYLEVGSVSDPHAFAAVVVSDSMKPALEEGDQVVLSPLDPHKADPRLTNGKLVFARLSADHGGGCTFVWFAQRIADARARLFDSVQKLRQQGGDLIVNSENLIDLIGHSLPPSEDIQDDRDQDKTAQDPQATDMSD